MKKIFVLGFVSVCISLLTGCTSDTAKATISVKKESDRQAVQEIPFSKDMFVRGGVSKSGQSAYAELVTSADALEASVTGHKLEEELLLGHSDDFFDDKDILLIVFSGNTELGYHMKCIQKENKQADIYLERVLPGACTSYHDVGTNYTYAVEIEKGRLTKDYALKVHIGEETERRADTEDAGNEIKYREQMFVKIDSAGLKEDTGENSISLLTSAGELQKIAAKHQVELPEDWQVESFLEDKDILWVRFQGRSGLAYCLTDIRQEGKTTAAHMKEICPAVMLEPVEEYADYVYAVAVDKGAVSAKADLQLTVEDVDPVSLKRAEVAWYAEERKLGLVKNIIRSEGKVSLEFDEVELTLDEESGQCHIENTVEQADSYAVSEHAVYRILDSAGLKNVEEDVWIQSEQDRNATPFWIILQGDEVVQIEEQPMSTAWD